MEAEAGVETTRYDLDSNDEDSLFVFTIDLVIRPVFCSDPGVEGDPDLENRCYGDQE